MGQPPTTTVYIFSGSKVIAEYVNGALSKEYVYAGSTLLATVAAGGTRTYHHADHLSVRADTNADGALTRSYGHFPFGETWYEEAPQGETLVPGKWKFTSYERDSESQLDYAIYRGYNSRLGRFMQADPLGGRLSSPQSLNRYSYVANDPINRVDPLGLDTGSAWFDWWMNAANNTYRSGPGLAAEFADLDLHALFGDRYSYLPGLGDPADEGYSMYLHGYGEDRANLDDDWFKKMMDIACDPKVLAGFARAWERSSNGLESVSAEAGFVVDRGAQGLTVRDLPRTNERRRIEFPVSMITKETIALAHVHPDGTDPRASVPVDTDLSERKKVPFFTFGHKGLYVYNPATKKSTPRPLREGLDWLDPCDKKKR